MRDMRNYFPPPDADSKKVSTQRPISVSHTTKDDTTSDDDDSDDTSSDDDHCDDDFDC